MRYVEKQTPKGIDSHTRYDWRELSNLYQGITTGQIPVTDSQLQNMVERWREAAEGDHWFGTNSGEMVKRIHDGYEFDSEIDPECLPDVAFERPRMRYTDDPEGEFDHDLYMNGETEYFLTKPKRMSVGGLRLKLNYNFNAGVSNKTIEEYGQWIGTVVQSLQARGYDLEIEVFFSATGSYVGHNVDTHSPKLSNFGERIMPYDWSALFSPGGFRHFTFLMILQVGEVEPNVTTSSGMGRAHDPEWGINWEPRERVIEVTCSADSNNFPAQEMTERFESWRE